MSKTKETPRLTRGQRNNNPGNIRYNKSNRWKGLTGKDSKGFCRFSSIDYGIRALCVLLTRYLRYGYNTPRRIICRYAPVSENNTEAYIDFVCKRTGLFHDDVIVYCSSEFYQLVCAIMLFESNVDMPWFSVRDIHNLLL